MNRIFLMLCLIFVAVGAYCQNVELSTTDLSSSMLKDKADNEYGKGNMQKQGKRIINMPYYIV